MTVRITVLGGFEVAVDDVPVPPEAWSRRQAAALVKLLAVTDGHRLHREQVLDRLWPDVDPDTAGPRLHKAAHFARRALGRAGDALSLRRDVVALDSHVEVDLDRFCGLAREALAGDGPERVTAALAAHPGPLLPEDPYEPWSEQPRAATRRLHHDLLRAAGRWDELLVEEPADEQAHVELARAAADAGDVRAALRQLERLDQALRHELGTAPGPEARRLKAALEKRLGPPAAPTPHPGHARPGVPGRGTRRLYGRRSVGEQLRAALDRAGRGRGTTLLLTGPPGVGKTALLDLALDLAGQQGWRTGRGTASAVEGPWPYAPVLEAIGDLCRRHPALLDGLDDDFRQEIERALSGRDVSWSGESGHQRLFVATAELVRLAAAGHGLLLAFDDVHEADEASLRLLHYLSRCALEEPVLIVLAHRPLEDGAARRTADSLVGRGVGQTIELPPLSRGATERLLADRFAELDAHQVERIWAVSGGLPFAALELARGAAVAGPGAGDVGAPSLPALPAAVVRTLVRLALLGTEFSTDELIAVSGAEEPVVYQHLEAALAALVVERAEAGFRFRHPLVREALLTGLSPAEESSARREVADALARLGAPPGRVAHQYLLAGLPSRAVPYVLRAVETAGALGAYRDGLALVDAVRPHAGVEHLPRLLARRGDLLLALGDPEAVTAYREAVRVTEGTEHRLVRARLARAAGFAGDLETARWALAGQELLGDAADGPLMLARGNLAYFSGDVDTAWDIASKARDLLQAPDEPWQFVDLVSLQGLIAHQRGEWFERFRLELRRTQGKQRLATALFDAHLCVAEYLLYGPVPYAEVIAETEELRRRAVHAGALRGVAFATALLGEAALLMGDLDRAERELTDAVDLHREIDAPAGEALSLERLAEVRLARGDRAAATRLLQRALPLGRFSVVAMHLLQRVYGAMIAAAPDPAAARAVVDRAEATMGETDQCPFCAVMLEAPAAIACADDGDLDEARRHLSAAEASATRWEGTAWRAAVFEARAHLALAEGQTAEAETLLDRAVVLFEEAGQPLDAARCRLSITGVAGRSELPV